MQHDVIVYFGFPGNQPRSQGSLLPAPWSERQRPGALSIQPKIPVISVGTSNGTDHFGLVRPEYSGPALKVVLFDRSGHFGRSDRNVPFHLTKLLSPVPLFCILLARTITKRAVAWVGSVEPECTVPLNTENFRNFKPEFLLNGKRPRSLSLSLHGAGRRESWERGCQATRPPTIGWQIKGKGSLDRLDYSVRQLLIIAVSRYPAVRNFDQFSQNSSFNSS